MNIYKYYRVIPAVMLAFCASLTPAVSMAAPNVLPTVELLPVVPGDDSTPGSTPFIAWGFDGFEQYDLSVYGYHEEEYTVSGEADIYGYIDASSAVQVIDPALPYTTRILVRKPENPKRFNGTVYVEVLNATAGWDGDPTWQGNFEYMTREGAIWVGVSTKPNTVNFLNGWNSARYQLAMPHFGQVWDMLSQTAYMLKTQDAPGNPLVDYDIERMVMLGYSQSAGYQTTYVNSFHDAATMPNGDPVYDAYYISAGSASAKHVTGPTATTPESLRWPDARTLLDPSVPTIRFQNQTEVGGAYLVRQTKDDNPLLRFYEMAGGSHVDERLGVIGGLALVRDLGLPPSFCATPLFDYNPIIIGNVQSALLKRLDEWVADGTTPPDSRFLALDADNRILLDGDGNAVGGIRPPTIEVPLGQYTGNNFGPGFCGLFGGFIPFSDEELSNRYRNHGAYVSKVVRAVKQSQKEGFLLKEEAATLRDEAAASTIGK